MRLARTVTLKTLSSCLAPLKEEEERDQERILPVWAGQNCQSLSKPQRPRGCDTARDTLPPTLDTPNPNRPANRTYGASVLATNPSEPGHATHLHGDRA